MSRSANNHNDDAIRFLLNGERVELSAVSPTRTVLQYLREDRGLTGTKEGCAEGDCGACTVALVELDRSGERLRVRAVNACIQFLATLDGRELLTIEGIGSTRSDLHPVQLAMLNCHGSQCGFCTPGFVMSLFAWYKNNATADRREIDDALAGNLCRCTGYQPIITAAQTMFDYVDDSDGSWLALPNSSVDRASDDEQERVRKLVSVQSDRSLAITGGDESFHAPRSADELEELLRRYPDATLLGGGTDVGLWVTKQHKKIPVVIYTAHVAEMAGISEDEGGITIGAGVTLSDAMPTIVKHYPALRDLFTRFASPPIRNAGTLGGNVANGSPIGDSMPALLALDAVVELRGGGAERSLALQDFYIDYQETALRPAEFVQSIRIPAQKENSMLRSYKISKRFDQDISAVCGAFCIAVSEGVVTDARLAFGGVAAIPKRAKSVEQALMGVPWTEESVRTAMQKFSNDYEPISDMRASSDYRMEVCQNLLFRFWLESSQQATLTDVYNYGR